MSSLGVVSRHGHQLSPERFWFTSQFGLLREKSDSKEHGGRENQGGRFIPDGVTSPQANPLGNGPVLLLCSGELLLGAERLVGLDEELEGCSSDDFHVYGGFGRAYRHLDVISATGALRVIEVQFTMWLFKISLRPGVWAPLFRSWHDVLGLAFLAVQPDEDGGFGPTRR